ncbi:MAG: peptidylprolyl isomerase [Bacteroidetes bacterium]|nr:peptidylprolyl isomerase [Bacteroidota bacterium]
MTRLFRFLAIANLLVLASSCAKPVADFTFSDDKHTAPVAVSFENKSKNAESYEWDFGDGNTSTEAVPSHTYRASGNFAVKLKATKGGKTTVTEKRLMVAAPIECLVEIETDFGTMTVQLSNATPQHRDNFLKLAEEGYFDGILFHRVIEGFMIQGGDPDSKNAKPNQALGMGGPSYTVPAEFVDSLVHLKGALSAARQGDQANPQKRSSGSQFYIVQGKPLTKEELDMMEARKGIRYTKEQRDAYMAQGGTPFLDRDYTVFGHVVKGLDVIDKIAATETDPRDRPKTDVKMKVRVIK